VINSNIYIFTKLSLHGDVDRRINILGFNKDERKEYVAIALSKCPDKKKEFCKYLKDNPIIDDLCL